MSLSSLFILTVESSTASMAISVSSKSSESVSSSEDRDNDNSLSDLVSAAKKKENYVEIMDSDSECNEPSLEISAAPGLEPISYDDSVENFSG